SKIALEPGYVLHVAVASGENTKSYPDIHTHPSSRNVNVPRNQFGEGCESVQSALVLPPVVVWSTPPDHEFSTIPRFASRKRMRSSQRTPAAGPARTTSALQCAPPSSLQRKTPSPDWFWNPLITTVFASKAWQPYQ